MAELIDCYIQQYIDQMNQVIDQNDSICENENVEDIDFATYINQSYTIHTINNESDNESDVECIDEINKDSDSEENHESNNRDIGELTTSR